LCSYNLQQCDAGWIEPAAAPPDLTGFGEEEKGEVGEKREMDGKERASRKERKKEKELKGNRMEETKEKGTKGREGGRRERGKWGGERRNFVHL